MTSYLPHTATGPWRWLRVSLKHQEAMCLLLRADPGANLGALKQGAKPRCGAIAHGGVQSGACEVQHRALRAQGLCVRQPGSV